MKCNVLAGRGEKAGAYGYLYEEAHALCEDLALLQQTSGRPWSCRLVLGLREPPLSPNFHYLTLLRGGSSGVPGQHLLEGLLPYLPEPVRADIRGLPGSQGRGALFVA